jgi:hypothetical protein
MTGKAVIAYFIMGRSENSRNRIFTKTADGIRTQAYDESKMSDPSLVIYNAVRTLGNKTIVTNGDQTDTIVELMDRQFTFEEALATREFEPDPPIYTPRISGIVRLTDGDFNYALSILKSAEGDPSQCRRFTYTYKPAKAGCGHLIHTYAGGDPPKSFSGEPESFDIPDDIDVFTQYLWDTFDSDNKISLYTRYINTADKTFEERIINKYGK